MSTFRTIKEARAAGFRDVRPYDYGGEQITVKGHRLVRNPQRAKSATEWGREGYVVAEGQKPHAERFTRAHKKAQWYDVYRSDQVQPNPIRVTGAPNLPNASPVPLEGLQRSASVDGHASESHWTLLPDGPQPGRQIQQYQTGMSRRPEQSLGWTPTKIPLISHAQAKELGVWHEHPDTLRLRNEGKPLRSRQEFRVYMATRDYAAVLAFRNGHPIHEDVQLANRDTLIRDTLAKLNAALFDVNEAHEDYTSAAEGREESAAWRVLVTAIIKLRDCGQDACALCLER